ncbi:hypothetical protein VTK56DRAFT_8298 [Thermocarpiscus australiensis]
MPPAISVSRHQPLPLSFPIFIPHTQQQNTDRQTHTDTQVAKTHRSREISTYEYSFSVCPRLPAPAPAPIPARSPYPQDKRPKSAFLRHRTIQHPPNAAHAWESWSSLVIESIVRQNQSCRGTQRKKTGQGNKEEKRSCIWTGERGAGKLLRLLCTLVGCKFISWALVTTGRLNARHLAGHWALLMWRQSPRWLCRRQIEVRDR